MNIKKYKHGNNSIITFQSKHFKEYKCIDDFYQEQLNSIQYDYTFYPDCSELEITIDLKNEKKNISSNYFKLYKNIYKFMYNKLIEESKNNKYNTKTVINFIGLSNVDYVFVLTRKQMPAFSICKQKKLIPNKPIIVDSVYRNHDTIFEIITSYELLGCFVKLTSDFINELKENGAIELVLNDGTKINVEQLLDRKVIFICEEFIDELCENVSKLKTGEEIKKYFNLVEQYNIEEVKKWFSNKELVKQFVFYHELGHAVFEPIGIKDSILKERQANFYASLCFDGKYDNMIEIYNNKIGKNYANPLLLKHKDKLNYDKDVRELYGER